MFAYRPRILLAVLVVVSVAYGDEPEPPSAPLRVAIPLDQMIEIENAIVVLGSRLETPDQFAVDDTFVVGCDALIAALDKQLAPRKDHPAVTYHFMDKRRFEGKESKPAIVCVEEWCLVHDVDLIVTVPSGRDRVGLVMLRVLSTRSRFQRPDDK